MSPYAQSEQSQEPSLTPSSEPLVAFPPFTPPLTTPLLEIENEQEGLIEQLLDTPDPIKEQFIDTSSLTSTDVKSDPILSSLAKHQSQIVLTPTRNVGTGFKARPAPSTTRAEGLGPRMTKTTALRLGLKWDDGKAKREINEKEKAETKGTPGYKREGLKISAPSLAAPTVAPRATRSSQLRTAGQVSSPVKAVRRDPQEIIAANKARAQEAKERRRKSITLPTSLSNPSIVPRQNKSSVLRTGGQSVKSPVAAKGRDSLSSLIRTMSALKVTSVDNVVTTKDDSALREKAKVDEKVKRRSSVAGVRSLGAPSIAPRLNKTALLRAPTSKNPTTIPASSSLPSALNAKTASTPSTKSALSAVKSSSKIVPTPSPGPRPTKASLLRAAQASKV